MLSTPHEMFYSHRRITNLYNSTNRRTHALTTSQSRSSIFDVGPVIIIAITNVTIKKHEQVRRKDKVSTPFFWYSWKDMTRSFWKGGKGYAEGCTVSSRINETLYKVQQEIRKNETPTWLTILTRLYCT
jgi:hypothetical protein